MSEPSKLIGTVARTAQLIRYLAENDGEASVTTIARDMGLAPSTAHRLLHLLIEQGFVERGARFQSYRVGLELYRLGNLISHKVVLADLAVSFMEKLVEETGEFCMLCMYVPSDGSLMLVRTCAAPHEIGYLTEKWRPMAIAWGASGRAILAYLPELEMRTLYLQSGPSPVTGESLPPLSEFRHELAAIREKGYSLTCGQKVAGAVGISAPVFGASGRVIGSLCLTIPDFRFDEARETDLGLTLRRQAAALSRAGGYTSQGMRVA